MAEPVEENGQIRDNGDGSYTFYPLGEMNPREWEKDLPHGLLAHELIKTHEKTVGDYDTRIPRHWVMRHIVQDFPVLLVFIPFAITAVVIAIICSIVLLFPRGRRLRWKTRKTNWKPCWPAWRRCRPRRSASAPTWRPGTRTRRR